MTMDKKFLGGADVDTEAIPNYLRSLADAVEDGDVSILSIEDQKHATAGNLIERTHRIAYATTVEGIDLFDTKLIQLSDGRDGGDTDD